MASDKTLLTYIDEEIAAIAEELRQAQHDLRVVCENLRNGNISMSVYNEQSNAIWHEIMYLKQRLKRMQELRQRLTQK
jgi:virulence-associated protein VapD